MAPWQPTRVRWVVQQIESSTGAVRVETDQGQAYAKLLGNKEGAQALFCDLVGTRAAAWLGLPTFSVAIVDVDVAELVTFEDGSTSQAGPAFVAKAEDGTTWGGRTDELDLIENKAALAGLIVLDTWLLNCDRFRSSEHGLRRNTRNVFLSAQGASKGKWRLVAMDHTHCFTCGHPLTKAIRNIGRTKDERLLGHFPEFKPHLTNEDIRAYAGRLRGFQAADARGLLSSIPREWAPLAETQDALVDFLTDRAGFVADNIEPMLVDHGHLQPMLALEE